jgi:hypothetical protein
VAGRSTRYRRRAALGRGELEPGLHPGRSDGHAGDLRGTPSNRVEAFTVTARFVHPRIRLALISNQPAFPQLNPDHGFMVGGVRCLHRTKIKIIGAVATSYLLGVSTRRMEKLVEQLGITRLSKSQVSEMARDLDAQVEAFRTSPLNAGPYTFDQCDGVC